MGTYIPPKDAERISESSTPQLFAGVIQDARDLAVGHLERMRGEISGEFKNLKALMLKIAIAVGVMVVGAILAGHFVAIGLIALGLPPWAGYGLAAAVAIVAGVVVVKRLPDNNDNADLIPEDAIASLKHDLHEVSDAASK